MTIAYLTKILKTIQSRLKNQLPSDQQATALINGARDQDKTSKMYKGVCTSLSSFFFFDAMSFLFFYVSSMPFCFHAYLLPSHGFFVQANTQIKH
jgi:hypothetical protein